MYSKRAVGGSVGSGVVSSVWGSRISNIDCSCSSDHWSITFQSYVQEYDAPKNAWSRSTFLEFTVSSHLSAVDWVGKEREVSGTTTSSELELKRYSNADIGHLRNSSLIRKCGWLFVRVWQHLRVQKYFAKNNWVCGITNAYCIANISHWIFIWTQSHPS